MLNPLINIPKSSDGCPIHIVITRPGAIAGTPEQRKEISDALPIIDDTKQWVYYPVSAVPLRFETMADGDQFLDALDQKKATDEFFVAPMIYDRKRSKWSINKNWAQANGELCVFAMVDKPTNQPEQK